MTMSNGKSDESLMLPPESTDVLIDAWREVLGDTLAQERASWQRERALIEAQAAQSIAELRTRVIELERKLESLLQQKLLDFTTMVTERLALVRDGAPGRDGEAGPVGERGEIGLQGPPGPQGEIGHEGKEGIEGKVGPQGPRGESLKGERGETGPQGQRGPQGQAGKEGRDGLSLIGPEGPTGPAGLRGMAGASGERGEPGIKGDVGPRGDPGETGPVGSAGASGAQGERGADGAPGKLPRVKHWQPDIVHYDGDVVRYDRGTYQALKDTSQRPDKAEDWICIASGGRDADVLQVRGTYDPDMKYQRLDVVAVNGGSFIARHDVPGPCPGEGWQLIARQGQRGVSGEKGERGERGLPGEPGKQLTLKGWTIDRENFLAVPLLSDGSRGPTLELRGLFEQFQNDVG
jgi:integrin beta 3